MAIAIYEGSVGAGKSFCALEDGLEALALDKSVVANFPIKARTKFYTRKRMLEHYEVLKSWHFFEEITVERLIALSFEKGWFGKESQCLVIIDEAGIMFNTRDWQTQAKTRQKWIKFLSQSRKFGYDFIFVAQSDQMIDKQIRGLVEYSVRHLKLNNGFNGFWASVIVKPIFWIIELFLRRKFTIFMKIKKWYQTRLRGTISFSLFKKSIADRYDTMRTFNLDDLVEELEKMYQGIIVPAPVLVMLDSMKEQIELAKKQRESLAEVGQGVDMPTNAKVIFDFFDKKTG